MAGRAVEVTLVNGLSGDPAVYAFFPRLGDAVLFDLGDLEPLSNRDLLKVRAALVSHAHIDHFIGFDRWLRVNIPHRRALEVCGPPGITRQVQGKLSGYLWNLLDPEQIRFVVHELAPDGTIGTTMLSSTCGFEPRPHARPCVEIAAVDKPLPPAPSAFVTALQDGTRIEAATLDHGTPSVAYVCQSPCRFHVMAAALQELGLEPGPWIRDLQIALANRETELRLQIGNRTYTTGELGERITIALAPKPVGYLTDLAFTRENLRRIDALFSGCTQLVCESSFMDRDRDRARDRSHLTSKQAALLAAYAGVERLTVFHVSNIYDDANAVAAEAEGYFERFREMTRGEVVREVEEEMRRQSDGH